MTYIDPRHAVFGRAVLGLALSAALVCGCDNGTDPGTDAGSRDAGRVTDSGPARDSGPTRDSGPVRDSGPAVDGGPSADSGTVDSGMMADAGRSDAGTMSACPCFGASEIAAIDSHTSGGGTRTCMTGVSSGTVIDGALTSSLGAQVLSATVQEISGFAGVDWFCGSGCTDTNDDTIDDCAGAALPNYTTMLISESAHDACEALIRAACE